MPHGITALGRGVILVTVTAFGIALLSTGVAYGVLVLRRQLRSRAAHKVKHILDPPPRTITPESGGLELGNAFRKGDALEHDPAVILPHNLGSYLPPTPPRAHAGALSPFPPPGLPPCKVLNPERTPVLVLNTPRSHRSVEVQFEYSDPFIWAKRRTQHQSANRGSMSENSRVGDELMSRLGLGLKLKEETEKYSNHAIYSETEKMGSSKSVTEQDRAINISVSPIHSAKHLSGIQSQAMAPVPPTLVMTPASMQRGSLGETTSVERCHLPSPPETPTLVLTSPTIPYGLDSDQEGRLGSVQNWSNVLGLQDFEVGTGALSGVSPVAIPKQVETPPQTPKFLRTPSRSRGRLPSSADDEDSLGSPHVDSGVEKFLDYSTFHARLAAFSHKHSIIYETAAPEKNTVGTSIVTSSSRVTDFDYEALLARRKVSALSAASRSLDPPLTIQVPPPARHRAKARSPRHRPGYI